MAMQEVEEELAWRTVRFLISVREATLELLNKTLNEIFGRLSKNEIPENPNQEVWKKLVGSMTLSRISLFAKPCSSSACLNLKRNYIKILVLDKEGLMKKEITFCQLVFALDD